MTTPSSAAEPLVRAGTGIFSYVGFSVDPASGILECSYLLGTRRFVETIELGPRRAWDARALEAARLVYLLAGVSYYKAGVPPVIDLGDTPVRPGERELLRAFYLEGLAELAYRHSLDLSGLELTGGIPAAPAPPPALATTAPARPPSQGLRAVVPFGGGMDSIVTAEIVRAQIEDTRLFVVSRGGDRFEAIEAAAAVSGLPVLRAGRNLDPQILRSAELGFVNGHVPVTGIISAIAVLEAVLSGADLVVMSNERSASVGNVVSGGRSVNHQWSKSLAFEEGFAAVLDEALGATVHYFSYLRPCSELWIAERLSRLGGYLPVFRSCNRAFHVDPVRRLDHWCSRCDKCCFVDLVLAPFVTAGELSQIFGGREPLADPSLEEMFATLLGLTGDPKPFECVGDVEECRAALVAAAGRSDRRATPMLHRLVGRLGPGADAARAAVPRLLRPDGPHHVPDALLAPASLV